MAAVDRETIQLLLVASHYISNARRLAARDKSILKKTIQEVTDEHDQLRLKRAELLLAHLACASTRLCTVCEKHGKPFGCYRQDFYEKHGKKRKSGLTQNSIVNAISSNLPKYIPCLLRDNVGHTEAARAIGQDRLEVLRHLTIVQVLEYLSVAYGLTARWVEIEKGEREHGSHGKGKGERQG